MYCLLGLSMEERSLDEAIRVCLALLAQCQHDAGAKTCFFAIPTTRWTNQAEGRFLKGAF